MSPLLYVIYLFLFIYCFSPPKGLQNSSQQRGGHTWHLDTPSPIIPGGTILGHSFCPWGAGVPPFFSSIPTSSASSKELPYLVFYRFILWKSDYLGGSSEVLWENGPQLILLWVGFCMIDGGAALYFLCFINSLSLDIHLIHAPSIVYT